MLTDLVFDIETGADLDRARECGILDPDLDGISAPSNYKDPVKIAEYIEQAKQKRIIEASERVSTLPLRDWFARVRMIGYKTSEKAWIDVDDEGALLRRFWDNAESPYRLVSFNGKGFDLPHILQRSLILRVPVNWRLYSALIARFRDEVHLDLHTYLPGSLDEIMQVVFGTAKQPINFAACSDSELAAHCLADVEMTYALFKSLTGE